jgi:hypothetical protein
LRNEAHAHSQAEWFRGRVRPAGERKIKYYKSTMMPGEMRQTPGKDSMGMDMVPVYEDEAAAAESRTIAIDSVTIQNMGIRTAIVTARAVAAHHPHRWRR